MSTYFEQGARAYNDGHGPGANPWLDEDSQREADWNQGFWAAYEAAREL